MIDEKIFSERTIGDYKFKWRRVDPRVEMCADLYGNIIKPEEYDEQKWLYYTISIFRGEEEIMPDWYIDLRVHQDIIYAYIIPPNQYNEGIVLDYLNREDYESLYWMMMTGNCY